MDDTVPGITIDADGICNLCHQHDHMSAAHPIGGFRHIAERMGKKCIVGLSGGKDSSYTLYLMKEVYGLNPIAVTFDNGWSTQTATRNIEAMTEALGVPRITVKTNCAASDDTMKAFIRAGLPDVEAVTDISFIAGLYNVASTFGIKNIVLGSSFRTEGITPHGMFYFDAKYVDDVHKKHGDRPDESVSMLWLRPWLKWMVVDKIKRFNPLYYEDYDNEAAKDFLHDEFGWTWYGGHHRENIITEWNNNYWLYHKFGTDLREVEYSALIRSHQMDRDQALDLLRRPPDVAQDTIETVCKRLGMTIEEHNYCVASQPGDRSQYTTYRPTFRALRPLFWSLARMNMVPWSFYDKYCR